MEHIIRSETDFVCYETLEACKKQCENWECVHMGNCDGHGTTQFVCLPVNFQYIGWLIFGIFLIVVTCCSSLVVCYLCQAFTRTTRHTDQVVFYRNRPKYSRSLPHHLDQIGRDDDIESLRHYDGTRIHRERY